MMKLSSLAVLGSLVIAFGCGKSPATGSATTGAAPAGPKGISKLTALTTTDVKIGDDVVQGIKVRPDNPPVAQNGDLIAVQYTGTLQDGKMFDTNVPGVLINGQPNQHAKPLVIHLGAGEVVPGFDQGLVGMKIGGERKIGIPPSLGYKNEPQGDPKSPTIPAGSDLLFDVKMLDIVKHGDEANFDYKDLWQGSGQPIKSGDTVQIEYTEKFVDGTLIETNVGKDPYEFTIGQVPSKVFSGLEQGVIGMKKGGVRLLRIPPLIAYGTKLVSGIPPNTTLIVQVKVLEVM